MKLCDTCYYRTKSEYDKPCIVYREDCPLYKVDHATDEWKERDILIREAIAPFDFMDVLDVVREILAERTGVSLDD